MAATVFLKLAAIFSIVAMGYVAGLKRWLGPAVDGFDPSRVLGNAAFYLFVPALLFRTTARIDLAHMPWDTVLAFFAPVLGVMLVIYAVERRRRPQPAAAATTRAITACFGNSVQLGIPVAAAIFGEAGLAIHVALVSLHAMPLLTVLTALVELDLARERRTLGHSDAHLLKTLGRTLRATVIHPVVLPVMAGLAWNLLGWGLPPIADEILATLGSAVVPVCLVLIGLSLAYYGLEGAWRGALALSALKLVVLPAVVLAVAHGGFGLAGLPLAVVVTMAALPTGSNALIFAQRYRALEAEASATSVLSTLGFVVTGSLWLALLGTGYFGTNFGTIAP